FMPFGFLVANYVRQALPVSTASAALVATIIGAATSLAIELLQAYLPSRDSSLLDFINNVLGTGLGALVMNITDPSDLLAFIPRATISQSAPRRLDERGTKQGARSRP